MANQEVTTRLSPEGRIVIPVEVRRRLNLHPGDVIHFGFGANEGRVEIFTSQHLIDQVWANNHGDGEVDSAQAVRQLRQDDQAAQEASEARVRAEADEPWDEAAATSRLLSALGLA